MTGSGPHTVRTITDWTSTSTLVRESRASSSTRSPAAVGNECGMPVGCAPYCSAWSNSSFFLRCTCSLARWAPMICMSTVKSTGKSSDSSCASRSADSTARTAGISARARCAWYPVPAVALHLQPPAQQRRRTVLAPPRLPTASAALLRGPLRALVLAGLDGAPALAQPHLAQIGVGRRTQLTVVHPALVQGRLGRVGEQRLLKAAVHCVLHHPHDLRRCRRPQRQTAAELRLYTVRLLRVLHHLVRGDR